MKSAAERHGARIVKSHGSEIKEELHCIKDIGGVFARFDSDMTSRDWRQLPVTDIHGIGSPCQPESGQGDQLRDKMTAQNH